MWHKNHTCCVAPWYLLGHGQFPDFSGSPFRYDRSCHGAVNSSEEHVAPPHFRECLWTPPGSSLTQNPFLKELAGDPAHRFLQQSAWGPASMEKTVKQELASTRGRARTGCPLTNSSLEVVMVLHVCRAALLPLGKPPRHPCWAIFSIALEISIIKILSLAMFIWGYPQTRCKAAHEVSAATCHSVNWLHQAGGEMYFLLKHDLAKPLRQQALPPA